MFMIFLFIGHVSTAEL